MKTAKYANLFDTEQLKNNMKQRAIRGGLVTTGSQGILFIFGIASTVIFARILMPEHFGLIGMVTALIMVIERFQDIGLGDAIVQKKNITHEQVSTLFWLNSGICILLAVLTAFCSKVIAWFYGDQRLVWITLAIASTFVFSGVSIQHQALIRRQMRFDHFAMIKIISTGLGFLTGLTIALMGYGYWALVWKEVARGLLSSILAWSFCRWRPGLPVRNAGVRSMLTFGGNITAYNVIYYFTQNLDSILIGRFFGAAPVGLYTRAKQLTAVPINQLLEPLRYISLPALSALQNDPDRYRDYFRKMLSVLSFAYMPVMLYIGIYANPIVSIALGPKWMGVVPIFRILVISAFATPLVSLLGLILLSSGKTRRYFTWGCFTNLSVIAAFAVGIRWGAVGIATGWCFAALVNVVFSVIYVAKDSPVDRLLPLKSMYKPAIASTVMGYVLMQSYSFLSSYHTALQLLLSLLTATGVYFCTWVMLPSGYSNIVEYLSYPLAAVRRRKQLVGEK